MDDKLVLYDEDGNIIMEGFNNDEDSGIDSQDPSTFTKENISKEGNIIDKVAFSLFKGR